MNLNNCGTKVGVECTLMAADAGYLDMRRPVVALGGWRGGADTAMVIRPAYSHSFFDLRILEFIAMPRADGGEPAAKEKGDLTSHP